MEIKIAIPTSELLLELTDKKYDPSISLYMPTHRSHPDNQKDIIVFKNLVKQITESLRENTRKRRFSTVLNHSNF
jgi:hypothetical protein